MQAYHIISNKQKVESKEQKEGSVRGEKSERPGTVKRGEHVYLSDKEVADFTAKHGAVLFAEMLQELIDYKSQSTRNANKYTNDAGAIRSWVRDKVLERHAKLDRAGGKFIKPDPPRYPGAGVPYVKPVERPASPETVAAAVADAKASIAAMSAAAPPEIKRPKKLSDMMRGTPNE